jgi:hypothetical protein
MAAESKGWERRDLPIRPIVLGGIVLAMLALIIHVALWVQFESLLRRRAAELPPPPPIAAAAPDTPPPPRLQTAPERDLKALRAAEDALLHGYGWIDRRAGIVRVPIERGMELVLSETKR